MKVRELIESLKECDSKMTHYVIDTGIGEGSRY